MDEKLAFTFTLDRRTLLAAAAACIPAAALIPVAPATVQIPKPLGDWSIDDQWSGYPRYADDVGPGKPANAIRLNVHPADAAFIPD